LANRTRFLEKSGSPPVGDDTRVIRPAVALQCQESAHNGGGHQERRSVAAGAGSRCSVVPERGRDTDAQGPNSTIGGPTFRGLVEVASQADEEGLRLSGRWLRALHGLSPGDNVTVAAGEGEARSRTWVPGMVERSQLVLRIGEDLEANGARWEDNRHPGMVRTPLTDDQGHDGVAATERRRGRCRDPRKGEACLPTGLARLPSERNEIPLFFTVFPVFNRFGADLPRSA
jgi:hypothetical protein